MTRLQLRPTFQWVLREKRSVVLERLQAEFSRQANKDLFLMYGEYGELHLPPDEHRLWSPHLSFSIVGETIGVISPSGLLSSPEIENENMSVERTQCVLHGRFAPRPEIWTAVWIVYLLCCFTVFFGVIIAYVQWQLGESLWGIGLTAGAAITWGALYGVAYMGQQWSSDQMQKLGSELEAILVKVNVSKEGSLG